MTEPPSTKSETMPDIDPEAGALLKIAQNFLNTERSVFRLLALEPIQISRGKATFALSLPGEFADRAGNVHGGLATIVLDLVFGLTVFTAMTRFRPVATINLRTDLVTRAPCRGRALCSCQCEAIKHDVAYVTGRLISEDSGALIALGSSAFMVGANTAQSDPQLERRAKKWNPVFRKHGATTQESSASGDPDNSPDALGSRL